MKLVGNDIRFHLYLCIYIFADIFQGLYLRCAKISRICLINVLTFCYIYFEGMVLNQSCF